MGNRGCGWGRIEGGRGESKKQICWRTRENEILGKQEKKQDRKPIGERESQYEGKNKRQKQEGERGR